MKNAIVVFGFAVFAAMAIAVTYNVKESTFTCLECRATWHKRTVCGLDQSRVEENDYSRSVQGRDAGHQHRWCSFGSETTKTWSATMFACGGRHPVVQIPVEIHATYAGAVSPAELAATLRELDSKDSEVSTAAVNKIYRVSIEMR